MKHRPHEGLALGQRRYSNSRPVKRTEDFHGIEVSVEFDVGETKRGIGQYGEVWTNTYKHAYGEIPNSRSLADGDGVDVLLGPDEKAKMVFVIHQSRRDGSYDEDKCLLQFRTRESAIQAYRDQAPVWGLVDAEAQVDEMTVDQFLSGYLAACRKLPGGFQTEAP